MCQSHPLTDVASGRHNLISLDMLVFVILRSSFLHLSIFSKATYISPIFKEHGEMEVLDAALSCNVTCCFVSEGLQRRRRGRLGPISV